MDRQPGSPPNNKKRTNTPILDSKKKTFPALNDRSQGTTAPKNRFDAKVTSSCPKKIIKDAKPSGIFAKNEGSLIGKMFLANIFNDQKKFANLALSKSSTRQPNPSTDMSLKQSELSSKQQNSMAGQHNIGHKASSKPTSLPTKFVYSGRGEGVTSKDIISKGVRSISYLEEVKKMALNTQIDAKPSKTVGTLNFPRIEEHDLEAQIENNCSIDDISPIDLKSKTKTTKKNFVIKSTQQQKGSKNSTVNISDKFRTPQIRAKASIKENAKSYVFPSSISAISSKVSEPKRYFFKDQNIFVTTKSKIDIFDEMMENSTKKSSLTNSTAASSKKSFGTENNWYMNDKTKKCMRALQEESTEPDSKYAANLDRRDPGRKKVRFLEDLDGVKTSREIGFYCQNTDKRDLKAFKNKMLATNWEKKITGLKN